MPPEIPSESSLDPVGSAPQKLLRFSGDETQEIILAKAMILGYQGEEKEDESFTFSTSFQQQGADRVFNVEVKDTELDSLVESFRADPVRGQRVCTENIIAILKDSRYTPEAREARARRYYDAYVNLLVKMDGIIYPETEEGKVFAGMPDYIPDGFSDMGKNPSIDRAKGDPRLAYREKGRVDKKEIYSLMKDDTLEILKDVAAREFTYDFEKQYYILKRTTELIHTHLQYNDPKVDAEIEGGRSVMLGDLWRDGFGVCRHQAMYVQLLNQMLGIKSQMFRNRMLDVAADIDFLQREGEEFPRYEANHAANLVQIGSAWYVVDATNPDIFKDGHKEQFVRAIFPEQKPGRGGKVFVFGDGWGKGRLNPKNEEYHPVTYILADDMHYRIRRKPLNS